MPVTIKGCKSVYHHSPYHQSIATGLQCGQADTKDYNSGKGVVIDESTTVSISMATIECQICVSVARKKHWAEVDLEGDGLHPTVHTDIPLRCTQNTKKDTIPRRLMTTNDN